MKDLRTSCFNKLPAGMHNIIFQFLLIMYRLFLKPAFDFVVALFLLGLLLPLFVAVLVFVVLSSSGGPFFMQERPGRYGRISKLMKFRTMTDHSDRHGGIVPEQDRITPVGKFLRQTSLDEIPQLINVLKGDMSLVGPRPLLPEYLSLYNDFQKRRHEVRPGITGWAQVNGRNALSWEQKFELDVWYVDNQSFLLDMKILFMTFMKVIKREGINASDGGIIEPFRGSPAAKDTPD